MANPTLRKISERAGVSPSTVSKVLSGSREISQYTAEKVLAIAQELGYLAARSERRRGLCREAIVIGVICPELVSAYYARIVQMLGEVIEEAGGIMTVAVSLFDSEREQRQVQYCVQQQCVDGLIIVGHTETDCRHYQYLQIPTVYLGTPKNCTYCDVIKLGFQDAIDHAIVHLKRLGHRSIGFIGERHTVNKKAYFEKAMQEHGLNLAPESVVVSPYRFEAAGCYGMELLLEGKKGITAVVCAYDNIALGAMTALKAHGLEVPRNISLIGMDDIAESMPIPVALTSIRTYTQELCSVMVEILMKKIHNKSFTATQSITVRCELVVRESTAPPQKGGESV